MKILIYVLIAAVIIIGGYLAYNNRGAMDSGNQPSLVIGSNGDLKGNYSLADVIKLDESYKCDFANGDSDSEVKGQIYIAPGGKVRGDFNITSSAAKQPFESHFILRDGVTYTWTSLVKAGFMVPVNNNSTSTMIGILSLDQKVEYKCTRNNNDSKLFEVPSDISFSNMNRP